MIISYPFLPEFCSAKVVFFWLSVKEIFAFLGLYSRWLSHSQREVAQAGSKKTSAKQAIHWEKRNFFIDYISDFTKTKIHFFLILHKKINTKLAIAKESFYL